jgi:Fe2+ or Zn2+ uptake regulation protein
MQETIQRLHQQGGRMTTQRRLILNLLQRMGGHPTAEELHAVVREHNSRIHLSTVYRTLRWLEDEGQISARRFEEHPHQDRYDLTSPTEHHHFQCTICKQVFEFDHPGLSEIKDHFESLSGALVDSSSLMLYGICRECQTENQNHEVENSLAR